MSLLGSLAKAAARSNPIATLKRVKLRDPASGVDPERLRDVTFVRRYDPGRVVGPEGRALDEFGGGDFNLAWSDPKRVPLDETPARNREVLRSIARIENEEASEVTVTKLTVFDEGIRPAEEWTVDYVIPSRDVSGTARVTERGARIRGSHALLEWREGFDGFRRYNPR